MREARFDQAKFLLIALVVFGHSLEPSLDKPWAHAIYLAVYSFHIPAFAFISGLFAPATLDERAVRRIAFGIAAPYLFFQTLYLWAFHRHLDYVTPYWLLWYLVSLCSWRLYLPFFASLRGGLAIALVAALAAGLVPEVGYPFSASRTLVFFPLFLLGSQLRGSDLLARLGGRGWRLAAALFFVALLAAAWKLRAEDPRWLYGSYGYAALGHPGLSGVGRRLALIMFSAIATLAFVSLVPRRPLPLARWGERSLNAYLLHGFLMRWGGPWLARFWERTGPAVALPCLLAGALLLTIALSSHVVDRVVAPLITPRWLEKLLWRSARPEPASR